jgi:hypothetical protein
VASVKGYHIHPHWASWRCSEDPDTNGSNEPQRILRDHSCLGGGGQEMTLKIKIHGSQNHPQLSCSPPPKLSLSHQQREGNRLMNTNFVNQTHRFLLHVLCMKYCVLTQQFWESHCSVSEFGIAWGSVFGRLYSFTNHFNISLLYTPCIMPFILLFAWYFSLKTYGPNAVHSLSLYRVGAEISLFFLHF